jgi:predicted extracellular nuclease
VTVWHINADEPPVLGYERAFKSAAQRDRLYAPDPFRSSDHDPVVVGVVLRSR